MAFYRVYSEIVIVGFTLASPYIKECFFKKLDFIKDMNEMATLGKDNPLKSEMTCICDKNEHLSLSNTWQGSIYTQQ